MKPRTQLILKEIDTYQSPTFGKLNLAGVIEKLSKFIRAVPQNKYRIIIGTDSEENNQSIDFVTALVVHRVGGGGIYFWKGWTKDFRGKGRYPLKARIYEEAIASLEFANQFLQEFKKAAILGYELEIHVDIGQNGETRDLISEVVGMIQGNGYNVKTKPEAYGASSVADRHV